MRPASAVRMGWLRPISLESWQNSFHVDAIEFYCHSQECVFHDTSIEAAALNKVGRELSRRSACRLSHVCVVVRNEDRKEAGGLRVTSICTNQVSAAGGLKEGLPGAVDPHWPSRGILRANLSGKYIGKHAAGMTVSCRSSWSRSSHQGNLGGADGTQPAGHVRGPRGGARTHDMRGWSVVALIMIGSIVTVCRRTTISMLEPLADLSKPVRCDSRGSLPNGEIRDHELNQLPPHFRHCQC
jgi:hypothetical protein